MALIDFLTKGIREAFADVPFPADCGLHAAMKKDDWVEDVGTLSEITWREDYLGGWWNIPRTHLHECLMALSYLDSAGMAFYLPAFMIAILEDPHEFDSPGVGSTSWQVIFAFLPKDENDVLEAHFLSQFSKFDTTMKQMCREFLAYVHTCSSYDDYAKKLAGEALAHPFWGAKEG